VSRRLLLDTGVLIAVERGRLPVDSVVEQDDDLAIAAITVAELLAGVELADDRHRRRRQEFVDDLLRLMPVESYGPATARVHARLLAHVRRVGKPRGAHDLIIAATAAAADRMVLTTDVGAGWNELPGVTATVAG
jgi:tRNA(fMet)-specific endonuclease VapC